MGAETAAIAWFRSRSRRGYRRVKPLPPETPACRFPSSSRARHVARAGRADRQAAAGVSHGRDDEARGRKARLRSGQAFCIGLRVRCCAISGIRRRTFVKAGLDPRPSQRLRRLKCRGPRFSSQRLNPRRMCDRRHRRDPIGLWLRHHGGGVGRASSPAGDPSTVFSSPLAPRAASVAPASKIERPQETRANAPANLSGLSLNAASNFFSPAFTDRDDGLAELLALAGWGLGAAEGGWRSRPLDLGMSSSNHCASRARTLSGSASARSMASRND